MLAQVSENEQRKRAEREASLEYDRKEQVCFLCVFHICTLLIVFITPQARLEEESRRSRAMLDDFQATMRSTRK